MNLQISFSGGETSAYMTQWLLENKRDEFDDIVVVFANTGEENEETLRFVDQCDKHFGFNVVWLEAVVHHGERKANTHRVVDFETASRKGEPFEGSIKKYGIPNQSYPYCTAKLKLDPMQSYMRSIGWGGGSKYATAVGIRTDEIDRMSVNADKINLIYPLVSWHPMTKPQINQYWRDMPFRLNLKGYQGNCRTCWKKSLRKHLTIASENPEHYAFFARMEEERGKVGPEFRIHADTLDPDYRRVFLRGNLPTAEMLEMSKQGGFTPAEDDATVYPDDRFGQYELDLSGGCEESCEVY